MPNKNLTDLRTDALAAANIIAGQVDNAFLDARLNEGLQEEHDLVIAANPTYLLLSTAQTTVVGGFNANTIAVPADFDKLYGVNRFDGDRAMTVPALPSYRERNNPGKRCYDLGPTAVAILPPQLAAGVYNLDYLPMAPKLFDRTIVRAPSGDNVVGSTKVWTFTSMTFDPAIYVGATLVVTGASNSANNGTFTVTAASGSTLTTNGSPVNESFGAGVVATAQPPATIFELSAVHNKWNAYPSLFAAVAIVDKRGMDIEAAALRTRLGGVAKRITSMAPNRRFEPLQQPLIRRRDWRDMGGR